MYFMLSRFSPFNRIYFSLLHFFPLPFYYLLLMLKLEFDYAGHFSTHSRAIALQGHKVQTHLGEELEVIAFKIAL